MSGISLHCSWADTEWSTPNARRVTGRGYRVLGSGTRGAGAMIDEASRWCELT